MVQKTPDRTRFVFLCYIFPFKGSMSIQIYLQLKFDFDFDFDPKIDSYFASGNAV